MMEVLDERIEIGDIVRLKLGGQLAQILGMVYLRYDKQYLLRLSGSLQVITLNGFEITPVETGDEKAVPTA